MAYGKYYLQYWTLVVSLWNRQLYNIISRCLFVKKYNIVVSYTDMVAQHCVTELSKGTQKRRNALMRETASVAEFARYTSFTDCGLLVNNNHCIL